MFLSAKSRRAFQTSHGLIAGALIGDQLMGQRSRRDEQQRQIDRNDAELERLRRENERLRREESPQ
jgi:hypothetical protein